MKRAILLFFLLFNIISHIKAFDESNNSLLIILSDENGQDFYTCKNLDKLKKCSFPSGPLRNNDVDEDFEDIPEEIVKKVKESLKDNEYQELQSFCIDSEFNGIKRKTCLFSSHSRPDLSYAFQFDQPLKDVFACTLSNDQLNDLKIEIATTKYTGVLHEQEAVEERDSLLKRIKNYLMSVALSAFVNALDVAQEGKSKYEKASKYIKSLYSKNA